MGGGTTATIRRQQQKTRTQASTIAAATAAPALAITNNGTIFKIAATRYFGHTSMYDVMRSTAVNRASTSASIRVVNWKMPPRLDTYSSARPA